MAEATLQNGELMDMGKIIEDEEHGRCGGGDGETTPNSGSHPPPSMSTMSMLLLLAVAAAELACLHVVLTVE